jgi:beta-lactamase superfamily II metal-dependent hydrolase
VVDCGGTADASGEKAARFLQTRGIFRIDRLILTHYDADHVNGAVQLMRRVHVGALIAPDLDADSAQRLQLFSAHNIPPEQDKVADPAALYSFSQLLRHFRAVKPRDQPLSNAPLCIHMPYAPFMVCRFS